MIGNRFYLKPANKNDSDKSASPIIIPNGKTIIGRGPFLGCSEKRISRNHAVLEVTDDGALFITPIHVNPCFYHDNALPDPIVVLTKDKPHRLEPGNQFSLLPDSSQYEVCFETDHSTEPKNIENGMFTMEQSSDAGKHTSQSSPLTPIENNAKTTKMENKTEDSADLAAISRTLPDWMLKAEANDDKDIKPVTKQKTTKPSIKESKKGGQGSCKSVSKSHHTKTSDADEFSSSSENDDQPNKTAVKPKKREEKVPVNLDKHEISDDGITDDTQTKTITKVNLASTSKRKDVTEYDSLENKRRKQCEFGKKCYRENPSHFKECSHPGDDDYTSDVEQSDKDENTEDDRPECEFGTDCYRKNRQHKKEYKHTKRPQRKAAQEAKRKTAAKGSSDEDSFESSFIDDMSDDDSNYSPDDEDLKTLKKEAKEFTSNKRLYMKS